MKTAKITSVLELNNKRTSLKINKGQSDTIVFEMADVENFIVKDGRAYLILTSKTAWEQVIHGETAEEKAHREEMDEVLKNIRNFMGVND